MHSFCRARTHDRSKNYLGHELTELQCSQKRYEMLYQMVSQPLDNISEDEMSEGIDLEELSLPPQTNTNGTDAAAVNVSHWSEIYLYYLLFTYDVSMFLSY